jgi:acylphosphatase
MQTIAITARITGRVQGVSYRAWVQGEAKRLGLRGTVRNESDGSVFALIMGAAREVDEMVRALGIGPTRARVTNVVTESAELDLNITDFRISR